jgi:iron complex outermembrane receptor protein
MPFRSIILLAIGLIQLAAQTPIKAPLDATLDGVFDAMPVISAATLYTQTLEDAPASVTVIKAGEIRRYGYRTLKEVLQGVRGFYFSNDRIYDYAGIRGFSIPGDWNSRFLLLLNGHPLTEIVYNSNNFFGQDFGLDLDLVERIEVIRGPNSAIYGSNGIFASINVVTKSPVDHPGLRGSVETEGFRQRKAQLSSSMDLGRGANLLLSASVFHFGGRDLDLGAGRVARGVDAQKGYHTYANLVWGRWSFTGLFNSREIRAPIASSDLIGSQGNRVVDDRNLIGANYTRDLGRTSRLSWRLFYDQYRYHDRVDYPLDAGAFEDNRTENWGDWVNSQLTYTTAIPRLGALALGAEGSFELRNLQVNRDAAPAAVELLRISAPDRSAALFAQQEVALRPRWKAYVGLRLDSSKNYGAPLSPRLALVYRPSERTAYKFVFGRPFRNPSAFERYYDDQGLSYAANARLTGESAIAVEVSLERKVGSRLTAILNGFEYRLRNVIEAEWITDSVKQYDNLGGHRSRGIEVEVRGKPVWRLETASSYVYQSAWNSHSDAALLNSPAHLAQARLGASFWSDRLFAGASLRHMSARQARSATVDPVTVLDAALTTYRLFKGYDLAFGVSNLFDARYEHPVDLPVDRMPAPGRAIFLKLIWQMGNQ